MRLAPVFVGLLLLGVACSGSDHPPFDAGAPEPSVAPATTTARPTSTPDTADPTTTATTAAPVYVPPPTVAPVEPDASEPVAASDTTTSAPTSSATSTSAATAPDTAVSTTSSPPSPPVTSAPATTATGPGPLPGSPTLVAVGNVACASGSPITATACRSADTAEIVGRLGPTAVLMLGDAQSGDTSEAGYRAGFDTTWGRFRPLLRPTPGEADYTAPGVAPGYTAYFGRPAGSPDGWYSFDIGSWHVIVLDSNCSQIGTCSRGSAEFAWLTADLAANPKACTLAAWHHPRFSSGPSGGAPDTDDLWRLLNRRNLDVVVNAHDQHYERFAPMDVNGFVAERSGTRQFIVGTGGQGLGPRTRTHPASAVFSAGFGVLELTLGEGSYRWRFVGVDGIVDEGAGPCH